MKIDGKQSVKLKSGSIKCKNHFPQIAVPLKFMLILNPFWNGLEKIISQLILHILKNTEIIFLAVLLAELYELMINLANQLFFTEGKNQSISLFKQFLKSMIIAKKNNKGF